MLAGKAAVPVDRHIHVLALWLHADNHLLELKLSQAYSRLEACGNQELLKQGEDYLLGRSLCLKQRLRTYLDDIDERLADLIRSDPGKFLRGPRVALRLIAETVRKHRREFSRVWILLFDGMRFDLGRQWYGRF